MKITRKEQQEALAEWKLREIKKVTPIFFHECCECGALVRREKMWKRKERWWVDCEPHGGYWNGKWHYCCTECAPTRMEALRVLRS